jgi:hypothetical protein
MSLYGNIAVYGLGIWANPMSCVDQRLRDVTVEPRQADIEASRQEEFSAVQVQVDLGFDATCGGSLILLWLAASSIAPI